ncbi:MAG: hypothetical protein LBH49_01810 [Puniceicoccales bacterium]|jgi:hypothetical protein|nr:hypothetical protein [Puniceicoccales bacterium]
MSTFSSLALKNGPNEKELAAIYVLVSNAIIKNNSMRIDILQPDKAKINNATKALHPYLSKKRINEIVINLGNPSMDNAVNQTINVFKESLIKKRNYRREMLYNFKSSLTPEELEDRKRKHCEASKKYMAKKRAERTAKKLQVEV